MPRWTDLAVTCLLVVCVAFLAELSEPLAAAAATAPLTSTASLIVWNKGKARNGATALELAKFALQLVKGA
jgi:hypothetical protein